MYLIIQSPRLSDADIRGAMALCEATEFAQPSEGAARIRAHPSSPGIAEFCAERQIDYAWIPENRRLAHVGLVTMDMDSTLITIECIDEIADMQGIKPKVAAITESAMRGEIDFAESLRRRVSLLAGLDVSALQRVYDERLKITPGAEAMLAAFRTVGAKSLLVSGGFTFFTDRLKERLGLDYTLANVLEVESGKLTGRIDGPIVDAAAKADAVARRRSEPWMRDKLAVGIGDGANDLPMLAASDVSVAFDAKPVVREQATHQLNYCGLDAVVNLFVR